MRKRSSRTPRVVSRPLSHSLKNRLLLEPRIHLELILGGRYEQAFFTSIAGLLCVGSVLAEQLAQLQWVGEIQVALSLLERLLAGTNKSSTSEDQQVLTDSLNICDCLVSSANTLTLSRAVLLANRRLAQPHQLVSGKGDLHSQFQVSAHRTESRSKP